VFDVKLLNSYGEYLIALGHLGLPTGDLNPPYWLAVGQRARQSPEQEPTML
jgi:hypothetical protein